MGWIPRGGRTAGARSICRVFLSRRPVAGSLGSLGGRWGVAGGFSLGIGCWGLLASLGSLQPKKPRARAWEGIVQERAKTGLPSKSMTGDWRAAIGGGAWGGDY